MRVCDRMNKKTIIFILLTILCMVVIFSFSSKNSNKSNHTSKGLITSIVTVYEDITNKRLDKEKIVEKLNYPIRKMAHYTLYFLLGLSLYLLFLHTNIKYKALISIIICLSYAMLDEFHQLFVNGRTGQIRDVIIDTLGSISSIIIIKTITKVKSTIVNKMQ